MELEWLKKSLSSCDARELRKLVDHDDPQLSVSRQCALVGMPRSTVYYRLTPVRESTLRIMASISIFYLEDASSGSRRMGWVSDQRWDPDPPRPGAKHHALHAVTGDLPETPHHGSRGAIRALSLPGGCQTITAVDQVWATEQTSPTSHCRKYSSA